MQMKFSIFLVLVLFAACRNPEYFVQKMDYDQAIDRYSHALQYSKNEKRAKQNLIGLETAYAVAQSRDSAELAVLEISAKPEFWPQINAIHRRIKLRQETLQAQLPVLHKKGIKPKAVFMESIDTLESYSRRKAAAYLYSEAQRLLSVTDSTSQRQPARDAFYLLSDLKANYFASWENTPALLEHASQVGKTHVFIEKSVEKGVSDGTAFWECISLTPNFIQNDWFVFYSDTLLRMTFDYHVKCHLIGLNIGPDCISQTERIEQILVADGSDATRDSSGQVFMYTEKYRTETKTFITYHASRSAHGTILLELQDLHTGKLNFSPVLNGSYNFDESSELYTPITPSQWWMIQRVADNLAWDLRQALKEALSVKETDLHQKTRLYQK